MASICQKQKKVDPQSLTPVFFSCTLNGDMASSGEDEEQRRRRRNRVLRLHFAEFDSDSEIDSAGDTCTAYSVNGCNSVESQARMAEILSETFGTINDEDAAWCTSEAMMKFRQEISGAMMEMPLGALEALYARALHAFSSSGGKPDQLLVRAELDGVMSEQRISDYRCGTSDDGSASPNPGSSPSTEPANEHGCCEANANV
jgi:hypothetical protein